MKATERPGGTVTSVGYDALGNILSKTGVGTYSYNASGSGAVRPHAVASIAGTVNGVTNPSYTYDGNGNMTAGAGRAVVYTAFNMAQAIVQGGTTTNFNYDPEHNRDQMYVSGVYVENYINDPITGAMEEYRLSGGIWTMSDYIKADGRLVAMRSCTGGIPCTSGGSWTYFVTDELGSVVRATDATGDPSSAHTERNAYDPWGRHRLIGGGDDSTCGATPTSKTTRGYTGHEQLNDLCLINANARIYDPTIARFMTPDSMVSDAMNLQDWNAYTYVNNRPMTMTDPTGHEADPGAFKSPLTKSQLSALRDQQAAHDAQQNNPDLQYIAGSGAEEQSRLAGQAIGIINSEIKNISAAMDGAGALQFQGNPGDWVKVGVKGGAEGVLLRLGALIWSLKQIGGDIWHRTEVSTLREYRLFGGNAKWDSSWWTPMDPHLMSNPRDSLAVRRDWNDMNNLVEGDVTLKDFEMGLVQNRGFAKPEPVEEGSSAHYNGGAPQHFIKFPALTVRNLTFSKFSDSPLP